MAQKIFKQKSIMPFSVSGLGISPELTQVQALMPIDAKDRENLKKDILESGEIRDPLKVYVNKHGNYLILCGYNRWQIAQELGWENVPVEILNLSPIEREELVWKDNLNRRHLTRDQKQRLVDHFLKIDPEQSDRIIAKKSGTDHKTVGTIRSKLETTGEIPQLEKRKGADNKIRKAEPERQTTIKLSKVANKAIVSIGNKKGVSIINSILAVVDELNPFDLKKLAVTATEESLNRLKGKERLTAIEELKKVIKRYQ